MDQNCLNCEIKQLIDNKRFENYQLSLNKHSELFKTSVSETVRYTSLIFSLGYISFISMLHMVYKSVDLNSLIGIVFFITLSCTFFILNEIWKMTLDSKYIRGVHDNWKLFLEDKIDLNELELKNIEKNTNIYDCYRKIYPIIFWLNLGTGFIALFIFIFKLFVMLTEL